MTRRNFLASGAAAASDAAMAQAFRIRFREGEGRVDVLAGGERITAWHYAAWDKPFLHPLCTASGKLVSRGFPLNPQPGESQDHPWHRGIWWGHGDINGHDFWRELEPSKTGLLTLQGKPHLREVSAMLEARFELRPPGRSKPIGLLEQLYAFQKLPRQVWIFATITVLANQGSDLTFGDTDDGGFAFRLNDSFRQDRGARLINSEGLETTEKIWGKSARWICYSAKVDGEPTSVVMFDHPSNLRHPTGWHARGYGLAAANPFAISSFAREQSRRGAFTVKSGEQLRLRYAVGITTGAWETKDIEGWYERYASSRRFQTAG
ncbi:MAG: PmoA family protein [Bryobacteraceae bacterium]|nr:PmoA family protein [Bryobacteraceae bacterium]MDW8378880.1 PmoA family protein [Bryobacterales bacterium]